MKKQQRTRRALLKNENLLILVQLSLQSRFHMEIFFILHERLLIHTVLDDVRKTFLIAQFSFKMSEWNSVILPFLSI